MEKKINFSSYFENDLFSEDDIDLICEKIEKNIPILLGNDDYFDADDKLVELNTMFQSCLSEEQKKIFKKYIEANKKVVSFHNCLAYYLGIQTGMKIEETK